MYLRVQPLLKFNLPSFEGVFSFLGESSHQEYSYFILVVRKTTIKLQNTPMNSR